MRFEGNEKNREGLSVKDVKWGERWGQSVVVMSHEGRSKDVKFSENAAPVAAAAPAPGPRGAGGAPSIVPPGLNTAARPTTVQKQPSITPTIPRPGGTGIQVPRPGGSGPSSSFRGGTVLPQGNTPQVAQPTNGGAPRQRVRQINQINNR